MEITRRKFLKYSVAGMAAISLLDPAAVNHYVSASSGAEAMGILVDTTRCVGCRSCQAACKKKNNLPADASRLPDQQTFPASLSANTFTLVEFRKAPAGADGPVFRTVKKQCMHCLEPACASVCPVGAIQKTPSGPVTYDPDKCMGCRYCMVACPFGIPKFEWDSANPRVRKCQMCADLVEKGETPACVQACPVQALSFGPRAQLIVEAQSRVSKNPGKYIPYIYGLSEVGGTSVLYLANVAFDQLGFNTKLPNSPLPDLTWQVMEKIPGIAVGVGLVLSSVSWWTHRGTKGPADEAEDKS